MPELKGSEFLLEHLKALGYALQGDMGRTPLTFSEIKAYMDCMNLTLSPSEVSLLRKMSEAFTYQTYDRNPLATPPYVNEETLTPRNNSEEVKNKFSIFV
jgi:hypothetical protein